MNFVINNISKSFNGRNLFTNISYTLTKNNIYILKEPSGSGKTTFLNIIAGQDQPDTGSTILINKDNKSFDIQDNIAYMPQSTNTISELTVYEHLLCISYIQNTCTKKALYYIEKLNLKDCLEKPAYQLSGGQSKRLSFIITLYKKAVCYIFDEPTTHLDKKIQQSMLDLIIEKKESSIIVLASHNQHVQSYGTQEIKLS